MILLVREILAFLAFASAIVFGTAGIVGLFRFSDPYMRLQAGSLCGTTAVVSVFTGALLLTHSIHIAARIIVIMLFFLVSSPTATHIVARFFWNSGLVPQRQSLRRRGTRQKPHVEKIQ